MTGTMIPEEKIREAIAFHGHWCPGLATGIRVAELALREIGRAGDEDIVAVAESDTCAVDAIQVLTGCTVGKGNLVLLGIGLSGIQIVSQFFPVPTVADFAVVAFAIIGSLMNTFIKPVVYAEIGYKEKVEGKIDDPLEGVGFFGRPETFLVLIVGGVTGFIWASVIVIAVCTNLSAIQRIVYLYRTLS